MSAAAQPPLDCTLATEGKKAQPRASKGRDASRYQRVKKVGIILGVVLVALCGVGYVFMQGQRQAAEAKKRAAANLETVTRQDLEQKVVETGTIDAVKSVEIKSRASGRLKRLYVDEGDRVSIGQLVAEIDPQETELKVRQDEAQLRGAISAVNRTSIEIEQRRATAAAALRQTEIRVEQIRTELQAQPRITSSAIRVAQASLETARKEVERLRTTAHPNQRVATETALREAEANYENAKSEYERQRALREQGFVASKVVENASLSLELASARLKQARESAARLDTQLRIEMQRAEDDVRRATAELDRVQANAMTDINKKREYENAIAALATARASLRDVDALQQSRVQSQSSVDQLQSVVADSRRQLGETQIRSTLNGIVTKRLMQEGELVASLSSFSSGTPILRVEDRAALRVKLTINEIDTAKLSLGMKASVEVDAIPDKVFTGKVRKIAPASTAISATATNSFTPSDSVVKYEVEIYLDDVDERLRSGMSAKCTLTVASRKKVLTLPTEYVGKDADGRFVELPADKPGGEPRKVRIQVGLVTGARIEILSGVKEGDKVQRPKFTGPSRSGLMGPGNN